EGSEPAVERVGLRLRCRVRPGGRFRAAQTPRDRSTIELLERVGVLGVLFVRIRRRPAEPAPAAPGGVAHEAGPAPRRDRRRLTSSGALARNALTLPHAFMRISARRGPIPRTRRSCR